MRAHSGKIGSHSMMAFESSQSKDLELILKAERIVKLFIDLDFFECLNFDFFFL